MKPTDSTVYNEIMAEEARRVAEFEKEQACGLNLKRFTCDGHMLGKRAPRKDHRTLKLSNYLTPALPPPPIRAGWIEKVPSWPMYMNDTLGDCVIAGMGRMIQQWTAFSKTEVRVTETDILKGYEHVGGYIPGDPSTDNGCFMLDALKYWHSTGIGGHRILGFISVNQYKQTEVKHAINLFGNVFIGINLPLLARDSDNPIPGGKRLWQMHPQGLNGDGSPGSWGGHAVPIMGYSDDPAGHPGVELITWGRVYDATWKFIHNYTDEMWVILTEDWLNAQGRTPLGLNLQQLAADIEYVRS